ncbi:MAG: CapA family protein, partial [Fidelibacterota bacterium]
ELTTVGAGRDFPAAYALKVVETKGLKVGILAYGEAQFGAILHEYDDSGGFAWINHPRVNDYIVIARKKVDLLIIQVHAGVEEIDLPLPEWRDRYRQLIHLGADAVIGHHPHVRQGWELYQGKPVVYSLGNFILDPFHKRGVDSTGFLVELTYDGGVFSSIQFYPVVQKNGIVEIDQQNNAELEIERLSGLLSPSEEYENSVNHMSVKLWQSIYKEYYKQAAGAMYGKKFLRSLARITRNLLSSQARIRNDLLLLHNIRIESHRWCVERALSILINEKYH